jgi:signal transduction histidine kinase
MEENLIVLLVLAAILGFAVAGILFMLVISYLKGRLAEEKRLRQQYHDYASQVAHELKSPLAGVKVLADSLLAQEDAEISTYREFLQDICEEVDRECAVVDELLSMQQTDSGEMADAAGVAEQIVKLLKPIAEQNQVSLGLISDGGEHMLVNRAKFSLITKNLVENAVKYNRPNGWVRVELTAKGQTLSLRVLDNGIGIPKEEQTKIFNPSYRAENVNGNETPGFGLGLALTAQTVKMLGGEISVVSKEQEGTTFEVILPVQK